jgi:hypothetical protein
LPSKYIAGIAATPKSTERLRKANSLLPSPSHQEQVIKDHIRLPVNDGADEGVAVDARQHGTDRLVEPETSHA